MPLSWNEIKNRAITFTKEWENEKSEDAEAKSFWDDFFNIFGISRRRIAVFEKPIKKQDGKQGFIDLLWKRVILVEHKSRGKDLDKAFQQAKDYFPGLKDHELPKYILVSDFERFRLYNLEEDKYSEFLLKELYQNIHLFGFIAGYEKRVYKEQDPANIEAAERMGKLHDALEGIGYKGHDLEVYLVRLLFCLFAEDTGIFERTQFQEYIDIHTKEDGSDLGMHLHTLFEVLNTPKEERFFTLSESLNAFPYVNGKLFEERLRTAAFNTKMRNLLLFACSLDWSKISPAIFGSMFQAVMNPKERRNLGAHYTSEKNIQKVIKPLFLDSLYQEFEKAKGSSQRLQSFHTKLSMLYFLDPACGCGNFLIIAYRELRKLEILLLKELHKTGQTFLDVSELIKIDVNQFAGIEYDEFPARIAEVAMWLIDHQMNMEISLEFGQYYTRLPLRNAAVIVNGNALTVDWYELERRVVFTRLIENGEVNTVVPSLSAENEGVKTIVPLQPPQRGAAKAKGKGEEIKYNEGNIRDSENQNNNTLLFSQKEETKNVGFNSPLLEERGENNSFTYILGNPPFIGKQLQTAAQKEDMALIFQGIQGAGVMDYVAAWYLKAAQFIQGTRIKVAFVSTNSIAQGEQVGILWNKLFKYYHIKIHFAHQTFSWSNEAKGNAAVHCIIVGFAAYDTTEKRLFEYENIKEEANERKVKNITPYLTEGEDIVIQKRTKPLLNISEMVYGSKANDDGNFFLTEAEKIEYITAEPAGEKFIKVFIGSEEYINNVKRYCFWLMNILPNELKKLPILMKKIEAVKKSRLQSPKIPTQKQAAFPTLFTEIRQPESNYLIIPSHSSENRIYIPMGFFNKEVIIGNSAFALPNASLFLFGQLTSLMHMAWVKYTCGRLESRFRYSNTIVYNNYPFPQGVTDAQYKKVEAAAQVVLDVRAKYSDSSLADLYDSLSMPPDLVKAHQALDKAVDLCYRPQPFVNELSRIEFLFGLYAQYTAPMFLPEKKKRGGKKKE